MPHRKCAVTKGKQRANPSLIAVNEKHVLGNDAFDNADDGEYVADLCDERLMREDSAR